MFVIEVLAWVLAIGISIPLLVIAVECFAALLPRKQDPLPPAHSRPRLVVLIPAHNEGVHLIPTLQSVAKQLVPGDRILVVADNCTDDTAAIAKANGADVVERTDPDRRGKGYALAFGRDALKADPPEVVIVIDADCTISPDTLSRLAVRAAETGRPVQAANRLSAPSEAGPARAVAAFAFLLKNVVRSNGLKRLGGHCILTGTGMAFPWAIFIDAPLAHGQLAEDLGLTTDMAVIGVYAVYVPEAEVRGEFPADHKVAAGQRRRWEHGHLQVLFRGVPRLMALAVRKRKIKLFGIALDIGVPPLSGLVMTAGLFLLACIVWGAVGGSWGPAIWLGSAGGLAATAITAAWIRFGRAVLPIKTVIYIPGYIVSKLGLYLDFVFRQQKAWVRTDRTESQVAAGSRTVE